MMESVLVAGAGAWGSAIAYELGRRGVRVVVADPAPPADNASGVAAGMLAPVFESLLDSVAPDFALLMAARDLWPELAGGIGLALDTQGALAIGDASQLDAWSDRLSALGVTFRRRTKDALRDGAPWMEPPGGAIWTGEDWRLSPCEALRALRAGAETLGVSWRSAAVETFSPGQAVLDTGEVLACEALVIATGASRSLARLAPEVAGLTPIKGQILTWPSVSLSGPVVRAKGAYICPAPGGVTVGATMEIGKSDLDIDPGAVARLREAATAVVPALAGKESEARAGVRAASADGLPLVGRSRMPGVWLAVGARRNGWLLAPLVSRWLSDLLTGVAVDVRAAAFDPSRHPAPAFVL